MKNILTALALGLSVCFTATAQTKPKVEKPKVEVTSLKQSGETTRFTVTGSKPFIYSNNKYILHAGGREFSRYEQSKKGGKGIICFLIPSKEFARLPQGEALYLTYGSVDENADMKQLALHGKKCWSLGPLDKNKLTK